MQTADPRTTASRTARRAPERLTWLMWAMVAGDAAILWLAKDGPRGGFNNDAAGNGLARAVQDLFVMTGAGLVGIIALVFLVMKNRAIRITLLCVLAFVGLFACALL